MPASHISFGPFVFDRNQRVLTRDGAELLLPPRVLAVLEVLLHRAGELVPRQELIESVWKDAFVTDTSLAEAVSVLRQALGDDPQAPSYIQTVHRRGYRFVAPTTAVDTTPAAAASPSRPADVSPSIARQLLPWSMVAVLAVLASAAVWKALQEPEAPAMPVTRFVITAAPATRFDESAPSLALSPDGSCVAWSACDESGCRLYVRASDELEPRPLAGTEAGAAPFFSPDGRALGFFANGHLKKISVSGGSPVTLADAADPLGAVWLGDEIVYAGATAGLMVIPDVGGEPAVLTTPRASAGEIRHVWPASYPKSHVVLFTVTTVPEIDGSGRLAMLRLDRPESGWTMLLSGVGRAMPLGGDALAFSSGPELLAIGFDERTRTVSGTPHTSVRGLAMSRGVAQFAVAANGSLLTVEESGDTDDRSALVWWTAMPDRASASPPREVGGLSRNLESLSLSPDGRRAAGVERVDASRTDIWISELGRGAVSRLTHAGINAAPVWSADGRRMFFAASSGGTFTIQAADLDSPGSARPIYTASEHAFPTSVSADGTLLAASVRGPGTGSDVWGVPLNGGTAQPLIRTPFEDAAAVFSPDGRFVAYQSNDAGRWEIYLHRRTDGRRIIVSTDGGTDPFWSADGRTLFFRTRDAVMRVTVSPESEPGSPELVARADDAMPIAADSAGRILFQRRPRPPQNAAVMTLQWAREIRQILGPPAAALPR